VIEEEEEEESHCVVALDRFFYVKRALS